MIDTEKISATRTSASCAVASQTALVERGRHQAERQPLAAHRVERRVRRAVGMLGDDRLEDDRVAAVGEEAEHRAEGEQEREVADRSDWFRWWTTTTNHAADAAAPPMRPEARRASCRRNGRRSRVTARPRGARRRCTVRSRQRRAVRGAHSKAAARVVHRCRTAPRRECMAARAGHVTGARGFVRQVEVEPRRASRRVRSAIASLRGSPARPGADRFEQRERGVHRARTARHRGLGHAVEQGRRLDTVHARAGRRSSASRGPTARCR